MKYKALLFGSIGTLIESSDIQRNSFNEAFQEAGLDWYWDEQDYKILLKKSGGTKRVEDFAEKNNQNVNATKIRNRKTEIFSSYIARKPLEVYNMLCQQIINEDSKKDEQLNIFNNLFLPSYNNGNYDIEGIKKKCGLK